MVAQSQNKCLAIFEKFYTSNQNVSEETLAQIDEISRREEQEGVPSDHRTKSYLVKQGSQFVKTKLSIVIIHGLLNSPSWMEWMAESAHKMGFNVINIRLPKHFSGNRQELDHIKAEDFVELANAIGPLAAGLGKKVVYISHSTGGLVSSLAAMKNPSQTAGLILFSPAFSIQTETLGLSYGLSAVGVSGWIKGAGKPNTSGDSTQDNRYMSTYAGVEVNRLAHIVSQQTPLEGGMNPGGPYAAAKQLFNKIPTLWIDTAVDGTIDAQYNVSMATAASQVTHYLYPSNLGIMHNRTFSSPKDSSSWEEAQAKLTVQNLWQNFLKDRE